MTPGPQEDEREVPTATPTTRKSTPATCRNTPATTGRGQSKDKSRDLPRTPVTRKIKSTIGRVPPTTGKGTPTIRRPTIRRPFTRKDTRKDTPTTKIITKRDTPTTGRGMTPKRKDTPTKRRVTPTKRKDIGSNNSHSGSDTPTVKSDVPTTGSDTPAAESDVPTTGSDTPAAESTVTDTPAARSDTPTAESGTPTMRDDTPAAENGMHAAGGDKPTDDRDEMSFFPGEEAILAARGEILTQELNSINKLEEKLESREDTDDIGCGIQPSDYVSFRKMQKEESSFQNPGDPISLGELQNLIPWERESCSEGTLSCENSEEFIERIVEECSFLRKSKPSSEDVKDDRDLVVMPTESTGFIVQVQEEQSSKQCDELKSSHIDIDENHDNIIDPGDQSEMVWNESWEHLAKANFEDAIANETPWLTWTDSQGITVTKSEIIFLAEISSTDLLLLESEEETSLRPSRSDLDLENSKEGLHSQVTSSSSLPVLKRYSSPPSLLRSCASLTSSGYSSHCSNNLEEQPTSVEISTALSNVRLEKLEMSSSSPANCKIPSLPPSLGSPVTTQSLGNIKGVVASSLEDKDQQQLLQCSKSASHCSSSDDSGVDHSYKDYLKVFSNHSHTL